MFCSRCRHCGECCGHAHALLEEAQACASARGRYHDRPIVAGECVHTLLPGVFVGNLAQEARINLAFRRVLHTGPLSQLVVMSLLPGESLGRETHRAVQQTLGLVEGRGTLSLPQQAFELSEGGSLVIPPGVSHDLQNTGRGRLSLWTLYAPPNHLPGRVHLTRRDAKRDLEDEAFGRRVGG